MRDLLRLLVVGAMSLAIVGIAMLYSRGGDLPSAMRSVTAGVSDALAGVSQTVNGASAPPDAAPIYQLALARPHAGRWVGLAGFPDQTEVSFPLPQGGHYLAGTLNLAFDTQLTAAGDGLMTLSVNGTARGQVVLDSGRTTHQVQIELTPADLAGDRVVLQLAGRGTTGGGQICPTDAANVGSAVTLSADSRLELSSDQPLTNATSALVVAPQPFVLTADPTASGGAFAIWANQQFNRAGIAARIGTAGLGETAIRVSDHAAIAANVAASNVLAGQGAVGEVIAAAGAAMPVLTSWPVSVAELGAETTVKTFRGSRRWLIAFNAADLPNGALPEQFSLRLATTLLAGTSEWLLRLTLNGNLIDTKRLSGSASAISRTVNLPAERLLPNNVLQVELVDATPNENVCTRLPDVQAQLLPESALIDTAPPTMAWAQLIERLASSPQISIDAWAGLSPAQANAASDVLASLLPRTGQMMFDAQGAGTLTVTDRSNLAQQLGSIPAAAGIVAILPAPAGGNAAPLVLSVPSSELGAALPRLRPDDVIILATGL